MKQTILKTITIMIILQSTAFANSSSYPISFDPDRCFEVQNYLQILKYTLVGETEDLSCSTHSDCVLVLNRLSLCGGFHAVNKDTASKYRVLHNNPHFKSYIGESMKICPIAMCAPFPPANAACGENNKCKTSLLSL